MRWQLRANVIFKHVEWLCRFRFVWELNLKHSTVIFECPISQFLNILIRISEFLIKECLPHIHPCSIWFFSMNYEILLVVNECIYFGNSPAFHPRVLNLAVSRIWVFTVKVRTIIINIQLPTENCSFYFATKTCKVVTNIILLVGVTMQKNPSFEY